METISYELLSIIIIFSLLGIGSSEDWEDGIIPLIIFILSCIFFITKLIGFNFISWGLF